jgi:sulfur carrier protein ThiS
MKNYPIEIIRANHQIVLGMLDSVTPRLKFSFLNLCLDRVWVVILQIFFFSGLTLYGSSLTSLTPYAINPDGTAYSNSVHLSPAFNSSIRSYSISSPNIYASIKFLALAIDNNGSYTKYRIFVDGSFYAEVSSGVTFSPAVPLKVGLNQISISPYASSSSWGNSYVINITRAASAISTLNSLTISSGTLSPSFESGTVSYTAGVPNAVSSMTVTPTQTDPASVVKVNGNIVPSGSTSGVIPLLVGNNTITVLVTAQNGITSKIYTVTVTRSASAVSTLNNLTVSSGTLSPSFDPGTVSYTASVPNAVSSLTVTPTQTDSASVVKVNGNIVLSGSTSGEIPLVVGDNAINALVTAQNGTTFKIYTVTVTRLASAISTLDSLTISSGTLSPSFDSGTVSYTASVPNAVSSMTVTPAQTDPASVVKVNGNVVPSGSTSGEIPLVVGNNMITVLVTAQNGLTSKTYTVSVTRSGSYHFWKENVFSLSERNDPSVSGEQVSLAGDGITNLMKYAFALDPKISGVANLPTVATQDGYLKLTYRKNKQATDLVFTVQAGNSLVEANWSTAETVISQTDEGSHWLITARDSETMADHPSRFMRLKVEMLPVVIGTGNLQILEALYGAQGGFADVRSIVEGSIQNDMVNMRVGNAAFGDPSPGKLKSLYIRYQNASGQYEANIRENLMLKIPDPSHTKIQ